MKRRIELMNIHVKPIRINNEIQCSYCGKSWDIRDKDVPECETVCEHNNRKMKEVREKMK
jgi:hypothetical protein